MANHVMYYECEKCNKIYKTEEKAELCCSDRIYYKPKSISSSSNDKGNYLELGFNFSNWKQLDKKSMYFLEMESDGIVMDDDMLSQLESEIKRIRDFVRFHNMVGNGLHPVNINN